ncbi:MAG: hypothetical protein OEM59_21300 [Rhodospirillales bacterium]|nr:hypothetical protein [Rhodospirillales bacterium]
MQSAKERIKKLIEQQPEDSSYEELIRELAFALMVERGLKDSDEGRTVSDEEMGRRIEAWAK